jgi:hypothetical protein
MNTLPNHDSWHLLQDQNGRTIILEWVASYKAFWHGALGWLSPENVPALYTYQGPWEATAAKAAPAKAPSGAVLH